MQNFPLIQFAAIEKRDTNSNCSNNHCSNNHRWLRILLLFSFIGSWLVPAPMTLAVTRSTVAKSTVLGGTAAQRAMEPDASHKRFDPAGMAFIKPAARNEDAEVVYLDSNGFIRIWDPQPPSTEPTVEWISPVGGWRDITLADVNQDGDMEILAVGGEAYSGQLTIYDPVITTGTIEPDQITNTIPWAILFESVLPGRPLTVRTGELNTAIPGPEIAFVFELNPEDRTDSEDETRLSLWQAEPSNNTTVDGQAWRDTGLLVDVGNTWEHLIVGDLDNAARDELILVDDGVGMVRVYRLEDTIDEGNVRTEVKLLYENRSNDRPWLDGTVARFVPSSLQQLALARSSSPGSNTFWVLYYDASIENGFGDSYAEFLLPPPRTIFAGDIDNNGDDELFLLRDVPASAGTRPHLIMRNYENEAPPLPIFEPVLDADNGYTAGTTGDTDGDNRAEVIIMRNNNIRLYPSPESGSTEATNFSPPNGTDQTVVAAGNLDRNGVLKIPQLGVSPPLLNALNVYMGEQVTTQLQLRTLATGAEGPIPFTLTFPNAVPWLTVTPQSGETNATILIQVDAATLRDGSYETTIVVTSPDKTVNNSPFTVNVIVTVLPGLLVSRTPLLVPVACGMDGGTTKRTLQLDGPDGLIFAASTVPAVTAREEKVAAITAPATAPATGGHTTATQAPTVPHVIWPTTVDWLVASSPNVLPTTMDLTFVGTNIADGVTRGNATLTLEFYDGSGRQTRAVDISFFCADYQQYLPLIR